MILKPALVSMILAAACAAPLAQAGNTAYEANSYIRFHYTGIAFGKPVRAVKVITGTRMLHIPNGHAWIVDTRQLDLKRVGDHFAGKTISRSQYMNADKTRPIAHTVQYWVQFEDGTTTMSDTLDIAVREHHRYYDGCTGGESDCLDQPTIDRIVDDYEQSQDTDRTFADRLVYYH